MQFPHCFSTYCTPKRATEKWGLQSAAAQPQLGTPAPHRGLEGAVGIPRGSQLSRTGMAGDDPSHVPVPPGAFPQEARSSMQPPKGRLCPCHREPSSGIAPLQPRRAVTAQNQPRAPTAIISESPPTSAAVFSWSFGWGLCLVEHGLVPRRPCHKQVKAQFALNWNFHL